MLTLLQDRRLLIQHTAQWNNFQERQDHCSNLHLLLTVLQIRCLLVQRARWQSALLLPLLTLLQARCLRGHGSCLGK